MPKPVFLSYRHENNEHRARVRDLAERLETAGLPVILDQFAQEREFHGGGPDQGWPSWSKGHASNVDNKVLIIASAGWFKCYERKEVPGSGLGAATEVDIIEQRLYNNAGVNPDICIVTFDRLDPRGLPLDLQRYHYFSDPDDFSSLTYWLIGTTATPIARQSSPEDRAIGRQGSASAAAADVRKHDKVNATHAGTKVFISYRRDDSRYQARLIYKAFLESLTAENVFMDIDAIPPGVNFRKVLQDRVKECDIMLALIGPAWIDAADPETKERRLDNPRDFVRIEVGEALRRGIPVVPVLIDREFMPAANQLPPDLRELLDRQAEFAAYRTFDTDVERLIRRLGLKAYRPKAQ